MIGFSFWHWKVFPTRMIAGNDCSLREKKNPSKMNKVAGMLLSEVWEYAHKIVEKPNKNDRMIEVLTEKKVLDTRNKTDADKAEKNGP